MKAVLFQPRDGEVVVEEVPPPIGGPGRVRILNAFSLISAGTERSRLQAGRQGLVGKARERPDQAREVVRSLRQNGAVATYRTVADRLRTPTLLGYSCAGVADDVGASAVDDLRAGSPVAAAGGGHAGHAEVVTVPVNLCVPVPEGVSLRDAAFTTVGAIALQGIHQADAEPGSRIAVVGLGLVGQLTARLLQAYRYDVVGIDRDPAMLELARAAGIPAVERDESTERRLRQGWAGAGADAVLVTAATKSADPVELAGSLARDRATVVVVGDVLVAPPRASFYAKELTLRYSRSYGPGRYDRRYEEEGAGYPEGYVAWPLRRNMEEFLRLVAGGLDLETLCPVVYPVDRAPAAYDRLSAEGSHRRVAILLSYTHPEGALRAEAVPLRRVAPTTAFGPRRPATPRRTGPARPATPRRTGAVRIASLGAGSFPTRMLFPHLARLRQVQFSWIATAAGVTASRQGRRWGFEHAVPDIEAGLARNDAHCLLVLGPHAVHAEHAASALGRGVGVFCEKPLALTEEELERVADAWLAGGAPAMVGFNRRFAPAVADLKAAIPPGSPVQVVYRVFAPKVRDGHWGNDPRHGGRLLGEACHFVDTASHLVGAAPVSVHASSGDGSDDPRAVQSFTIQLAYGDGSTASIVYAGRAPAGAPKELIEVAGDDFAARIDDFGSLTLFGRRARRRSYRGGPKGHREEMEALVAVLRGGTPPSADFPAALGSSLATCRAAASLGAGRAVAIEPDTPALAAVLLRHPATPLPGRNGHHLATPLPR